MAELKPCPFCGGKAEYDPKKVKIECSKCRATIYGYRLYKKAANYQFFLAALWNQRAGDSK